MTCSLRACLNRERLCRARKTARRHDGAFEISQDVVDVLDADGKAHIAIGNTRRRLILCRELRMRCARGMDRQTARIADVGHVVEQLQAVDEPAPRLATARKLEAHEPAEAAFEILLRALAMSAGLQAGMDHPHHLWPLGQPLGNRGSILRMACNAKWKRFEPLEREERIEGRECRAQIPQQRHASLEDVGDGTERLRGLAPDRAVIAPVRGIESRLTLGMRGPIEVAAIDDQAPIEVPWPARYFVAE